MKKQLTKEQKDYLKWIKKDWVLQVKKMSFKKMMTFIKEPRWEICDFYIFRDGCQVVCIDKTMKGYREKPMRTVEK